MSLNWKEINLVLSELSLQGGKIQQALQITPHQLFFEIYIPKQNNNTTNTSDATVPIPSIVFLYISLENRKVRIHTISHRLKKPKKPQRFQQLLQSRIIGSHILDITHLHNDRIIKMTLSQHQSNEHDTHNIEYHIFVRLWSNHANIIFTDSTHTIIDLAFRRPQQGLMPGTYYNVEAPDRTQKEVSIRDWDTHKFHTFNEYIAYFYSHQTIQSTRESNIQSWKRAYEKQEKTLTLSLEKVEEQLKQSTDYHVLEKYGNHILNNISTITVTKNSLEIIDEHNSQHTLNIPLDPTLTLAENAQKYFNLAKKQKRSIEILNNQKQSIEKNIAQLKEISSLLQQDTPDLSPEQHALLFPKKQHATQTSNKKQSNNLEQVKVLLQDGPFTIMIGRNVKENDALLRTYVKGNDTWLHVRGHSGAYVFIKSPKNKTIPLELLIIGGQLAAMFSKAKNEAYADIYYTQVKHLKRVKGSPGLVTPIRDKNLQIKVDLDRAKQYLRTHSVH